MCSLFCPSGFPSEEGGIRSQVPCWVLELQSWVAQTTGSVQISLHKTDTHRASDFYNCAKCYGVTWGGNTHWVRANLKTGYSSSCDLTTERIGGCRVMSVSFETLRRRWGRGWKPDKLYLKCNRYFKFYFCLWLFL